jgi:hypothetical protein
MYTIIGTSTFTDLHTHGLFISTSLLVFLNLKVLILRVSEEGFSFHCKRKEGCFRQSHNWRRKLLIYQAVT